MQMEHHCYDTNVEKLNQTKCQADSQSRTKFKHGKNKYYMIQGYRGSQAYQGITPWMGLQSTAGHYAHSLSHLGEI